MMMTTVKSYHKAAKQKIVTKVGDTPTVLFLMEPNFTRTLPTH